MDVFKFIYHLLRLLRFMGRTGVQLTVVLGFMLAAAVLWAFSLLAWGCLLDDARRDLNRLAVKASATGWKAFMT